MALSEAEGGIQQVNDDVDVMMAESVSETQDGYRPNISSYAEPKMREEKAPPAAPLALETLSIFSGKLMSSVQLPSLCSYVMYDGRFGSR